ncbi:EamA family transporter RarD [Campylobacter corcagiensis]|nr:EamA family transporter RarD [Campylobacter corcagiensis]QKF64479.1 resistance permease RarD [Campylobacter corcagiensis]
MNKGLFYGIASFVMWGLFPVYFKAIQGSSSEVLAYRVVFASIFVLIFIKFSSKMTSLKKILLNKEIFKTLSLAGFFVTLNWGIYIYAVTNGQILAASIGQLINPLFFMLLGAIFLKEKLSKPTKFAIFLVFVAIMIQVVANRALPFVSLALPAAFAIYGLIKKKVHAPALEGLFVETLAMVPLFLAYIFYIEFKGVGNFSFDLNGILLIGAGLATLLPLITFSFATNELNLTTIGFLQYITPTLTIIFGIFVYGEEINLVRLVSFAIIWIAVIITTIDSIKGKK